MHPDITRRGDDKRHVREVLLHLHTICAQWIMRETEKGKREAKIISLQGQGVVRTPGAPVREQAEILIVHTLEYLDNLLDAHFRPERQPESE